VPRRRLGQDSAADALQVKFENFGDQNTRILRSVAAFFNGAALAAEDLETDRHCCLLRRLVSC
jgi:hypothetical protein